MRTLRVSSGVYHAPAALSCVNMDTPWKVWAHVKPDITFKTVLKGSDMTVEKPHEERKLIRLSSYKTGANIGRGFILCDFNLVSLSLQYE